MSSLSPHRQAEKREHHRRLVRQRQMVGGAAAVVLVVVILIVIATGGGGSSSHPNTPAAGTAGAPAPLRLLATTALPAKVAGAAMAPLGASEALLIGGVGHGGRPLTAIVALKGAKAHRVGRLPAARRDASAATIAGSAYVFGGAQPTARILRVTASGAVSVAGKLPAAGSGLAAASVRETAYIVGGAAKPVPAAKAATKGAARAGSKGPARGTIVAFAPGGKARVVGHLPARIRDAAVTVAGGNLLIIGGTVRGRAASEIDRFDPLTGKTSEIGHLPHPTTHAAAVTLGGVVYLIGGRESKLSTETRAILAIDPASGHVSAAGELPVPLADTAAAVVGDHVLLAGGSSPRGKPSGSVLELGT